MSHDLGEDEKQKFKMLRRRLEDARWAAYEALREVMRGAEHWPEAQQHARAALTYLSKAFRHAAQALMRIEAGATDADASERG